MVCDWEEEGGWTGHFFDSHSPLSSRARRGRVLVRLAISARLCPGRRAERFHKFFNWL